MKTVSDRFWSKVARKSQSECWLWLGGISEYGYGRFCHGNGRWMMAHRWAYQELRGDIPDYLVLDHLCRVRACVNPWHLEPVTIAENLRRGLHWEREKTHCSRNHPFDETNTRVTSDGHRECRTCSRLRLQAYRERARALASKEK